MTERDYASRDPHRPGLSAVVVHLPGHGVERVPVVHKLLARTVTFDQGLGLKEENVQGLLQVEIEEKVPGSRAQ